VLVDDGQTVVLGGIFQTNTSKQVVKTPFLGDIPIIGRLFRRDSVSNNKQELLIFITPRLVTDTVASK
jgi:type IV pilus assembly protein PilQ